MIRSGLCSVTFRPLKPEAIINLAAEAKLDGIEWGGDVHVPPGDRATAKEVGRRTREAGLSVAAYGSYYRVGAETEPPDGFSKVIEAAHHLGAPTIRVWAGTKGSDDASPEDARIVVDAFHEIADQARDEGLTIAVEFHPNTLTDSLESAVALFEAIDEPNVFSYWQIDWPLDDAKRRASLVAMAPWLTNLHVFWREPDGTQRPLHEGMKQWRDYLAFAHTLGGDRFALFEFVQDGDPANLRRDAVVLHDLLDELN